MKRTTFLVFTLLWLVFLGAEEVALRQAFNIGETVLHVRCTDNSELIFLSATIGSDSDIYAQKLDPTGQTVWNEALPIVSHSGDQRLIAVVPSSDNNYILLWEEYEIFTAYQLRMQKISSNGQRLWPETGVMLSTGELNLRDAKLIPNSTGGAIVIYQNHLMDNTILGQNVDTWGNQLWPAGGLQLLTDTIHCILWDAVSDGEGGVIINVWKSQPIQHSHVLRFSPQGTIVGNSPLVSSSVFAEPVFQLKQGVNGQYTLYQRLADPGTVISITKMDNMGNLLLAEPVSYELNSYFPSEIANCADGGIVVSWEQYISGSGTSLKMQRFDTNFLPLWQSGGIAISTNIYNSYRISLAVNDNGNIWISWRQQNSSSDIPITKAQLVTPAGVAAWPNEGFTLASGYAGAIAIAYPDRGLFVWKTSLNGVNSIRRQVISTGGSLYFDAAGAPLLELLNGQANLIGCYALNDRFISLWLDSRNYDRIYYQLSNTNLEPLLQENGRALNPPGTEWEYVVTAQKTHDNRLALLYGVTEENLCRYYLQQIDSNGATLYPGRGIEVTSSWVYFLDMRMGFAEGDIYLGWANTDNDNPKIMGQRIANGQKMWGENGKTIAVPETMYYYFEGVQSSYYMWRTTDYTQNASYSKVLRVNASGDPATGWDASGLHLFPGQTFTDMDVMDSGMVGDNLIVFANMTSSSTNFSRAQKISSNGQRLWQDTGVNINTTGEPAWVSNAIYSEATAFLLNTSSNIRFQRITSNGEILMPDSGSIVATGLNNTYDAKLLKFIDGSYLLAYSDNDGAWIQNRDVYIRQITPHGMPMNAAAMLFCGERYQQYQISTAAIGNTAMLAWSDDRAGIINSEIAMTGVWAKSYNSAYVGVEDPTLSPMNMPVLHTNYPNPFNPTTTISFSLPDKGIAQLSVYNLKGQLVNTLLSQTELSAGAHSLVWYGCDTKGKTLSSGVYFYRLTYGGKILTRKMVLAK
ncbi:MAG: hypothetical protein CVU50_03610 [Candidatus Cloacimonetes bacterium HGW-Cloacimonetes-3]|jgi:hypothetical protein|nr:MAG: hypothetical protein CVU50_03610 [Candidatus Cloacimonetes bacterium HGW-Cloacimonetes-3]